MTDGITKRVECDSTRGRVQKNTRGAPPRVLASVTSVTSVTHLTCQARLACQARLTRPAYRGTIVVSFFSAPGDAVRYLSALSTI